MIIFEDSSTAQGFATTTTTKTLFIKGEMHNYRLLGSLHNGPPSSTPPKKKTL